MVLTKTGCEEFDVNEIAKDHDGYWFTLTRGCAATLSHGERALGADYSRSRLRSTFSSGPTLRRL